MLPIFLYFLVTSLYFIPHTTPLPHHFTSRATVNHHAPPQQPPQPTKFFQVTHPIPHPPTTPCTHQILHHDFANTYGRGPVHALYGPPSHCPHTKFSTIILEWSATCQGRQFDRIFGIWLSGVELLRSCTAEPTRDGIFWKIQKDISRYDSLLMTRNQTLEIYLGNLIDKTYTGIYHVNITIYYYPFPQNIEIDNNDNIIPVNSPSPNYSHNIDSSNNIIPVKTRSVHYGQNIDYNNHIDHSVLDRSKELTNDSQNIDFSKSIDMSELDKSKELTNYDQNVDFDQTIDQFELDRSKELTDYGQNLDFDKTSDLSDYLFESDGSKELNRNRADKILPVSRNLPLKDGLWFEIQNSTDVESKEITIPKNVYRAVLEIYISYHENDEFWYSNLPNEYLIANNITNGQSNGPFREVLVSLDGDLIGSICPFTVIYTGGINPLLWRPITAIGSFDLPTYDIEITPFLGRLLDGKPHMFGFSVTNALNVWYVDANLHLWLDQKMSATKANLVKHFVAPVKLLTKSSFKGLNGRFYTGVSRSIESVGWVKSSFGNITTVTSQGFVFKNDMVLGKDGNLQIVNQTVDYNTSVSMSMSMSMNSSPFYGVSSRKVFPLFMFTDQVDLGNGSYTYQSNVTLRFNEDRKSSSEGEISLRNFQNGEGNMIVKNNLVSGGVGNTHQIYKYDEGVAGICYFRNVSSYNYTVLYDHEKKSCQSDASGDRAILQLE